MLKINLFLLLFFYACIVNAQMTINVHAPFYLSERADVQTIKEKILLVSLEEEDPAIVKKLSKNKDELQWYRYQISGKNEAIKYAVENFWTFSPEKIFTGSRQVASMMKTGKYVLLQFGNITLLTREGTGTGRSSGKVGWSKDNKGNMNYNPETKNFVTFDKVTTLQIMVPKKDYGAIITNMPSDIPSKADAVYGIQQLQYVLEYAHAGNRVKEIEKQYKANQAELKGKTLLFDKEYLDESLTEEVIKNNYPYPFEITSSEKISQAILEKDNRYAFVQLVPMEGGKKVVANQYVCSASDGKIYAALEKKSSITVLGGTVGTKMIKEKHIKDYTDL